MGKKDSLKGKGSNMSKFVLKCYFSAKKILNLNLYITSETFFALDQNKSQLI